MLKELLVYIPLVKSLEQIIGYTKFMKDLMTKKRMVNFEAIDYIHHYSAVESKSLVENKGYLSVFTIPCTIRSFNFDKYLCFLGDSIILTLLVGYI